VRFPIYSGLGTRLLKGFSVGAEMLRCAQHDMPALYLHELFGHQRFIGQVDIGGMPFDKVTQAIELLGTEVAPVVRREMANASRV
jgi:hypothetical protein